MAEKGNSGYPLGPAYALDSARLINITYGTITRRDPMAVTFISPPTPAAQALAVET